MAALCEVDVDEIYARIVVLEIETFKIAVVPVGEGRYVTLLDVLLEASEPEVMGPDKAAGGVNEEGEYEEYKGDPGGDHFDLNNLNAG